MEILTTATVFNPELRGKAVTIKGFDIEGYEWDKTLLVTETNGEYIELVDSRGKKYDLHLESFEHAIDGLKITVLEEPANE